MEYRTGGPGRTETGPPLLAGDVERTRAPSTRCILHRLYIHLRLRQHRLRQQLRPRHRRCRTHSMSRRRPRRCHQRLGFHRRRCPYH
jgi:hypothetical protein